nr:fimbrial protein [Serratia marcescens]
MPAGQRRRLVPGAQRRSGGGSTAAGFTHYTTQLTATLARLPGQTVTAGKVDARAYVWVKVQ